MLLDIVWLSAFIAFLTEGRYATLIVTPLNTAAMKGTEIALGCSTNETIKPLWRTQLDRIADDSTIFDGNRFVRQFARLYKLRGDVGEELALVMNVTEETARRYICEEPGYPSVSAELVLLASEPVCSLVEVIAAEEHFQAKMECAVRYFGNWSPTMDWRSDGSSENLAQNSGGSALIAESVRTIVDKGVSKSLLTITGKRREELLVYNCTTRFNLDQKPAYTTAANVPDYTYTWSSPAITISPGIHSPSFVPPLSVAVILTVALIVTLACLLIMKRKLKAQKTLLLEREGTIANSSALVSRSRIEPADENVLQRVNVAEFRNRIRDTDENYECIEAVTETIEPSEHYCVHQETGVMYKYVEHAKNANAATKIPISRTLQLDNAISDSHQNTGLRYDYIDFTRDTTEPSENLLQLTRQTRPTSHEYLELTENTASEEASSKQKTHNTKSISRINLDFLIPIQNETY